MRRSSHMKKPWGLKPQVGIKKSTRITETADTQAKTPPRRLSLDLTAPTWSQADRLPCGVLKFLTCKTTCKINGWKGLPWWSSGLESTCQCKGHWSDPWSREIPYTAEQLSLCTTTTKASSLEPESHNYWAHELLLLKPMCLEPPQQKPPQWEACTLQQNGPYSPTTAK